jgi:hypothetical protein
MIMSPWSCEEKNVVGLFSFFLNVWDMKGCEEGGMMMTFVRMGVVFWGIMKG